MTEGRSPRSVGIALALASAASFGVTTPVVAYAGRDMGAFSTASLLYGGACASALAMQLSSRERAAKLRRAHLLRIGVVALFGAGLAPTLLAFGLKRAGATTGSLLLNLEAVFTALFAWAFFREEIGRRVGLALLLMVAGGVALSLPSAGSAAFSVTGALAVSLATAAWALDNTLTRALAEEDPVRIVGTKAALGASLTLALALVTREARPGLLPALALLLCGATGYGLSLRLYLLAQRRIGAARTGSIFAVAPFVGAAVSLLAGDSAPNASALVAAALFAAGVYLHATERHRHAHVHEEIAHEHAHRHDDGHHDHVHDPPFAGEHTHAHHHARTEHDHDHSPDVHHEHTHA